MKRSLACFLLLLVIAVGGSAAVFSQIFSKRDQVEITQETVFGDPAAAEGLTVTIPAGYRDQLFWETTCNLGEKTGADSSYVFFQTAQQAEETPREPYLQLSTQLYMGYRENSGEDGISQAYRELFEDTQPGTESERIIFLRDYYEYYPLSLEYQLTSSSDFSDLLMQEEYEMGAYDGEPKRLFSAFAAYFRIPVLEEETLRISIGKDSEGRIASTGSGSTDDDNFAMYTVSAVRGNECYFAFDAHTYEGNLVDVSQISGGFGIYRMTFRDLQGQDFGVGLESLETVYRLDPQAGILGLTLSEDESRLLLHTREGSDYVVTGIDLASMQPVQRAVTKNVIVPNGGFSFFEEDGFFVVATDHLSVFTLEENGECSLALCVPIDYEKTNPTFLVNSTRMAFDGERLAVCDYLTDAGTFGPNFDVFVYDETGLVYDGRYHSSLSLGGVEGNNDSLIRSTNQFSITVEWKQNEG